jgi:nucleotide-binding universal stress UspA family protein
MTDSQKIKGVVVGVDGSPLSLLAAEWAAKQAELTQVPLHVITVWHWPQSFGFPVPGTDGYDPRSVAESILKPIIESLQEAHPSLTIEAEVAEGGAADTLVAASRDAELLVIGRKGHSEISGLLLGSVSAYCVAHAHSPVVVVRT